MDVFTACLQHGITLQTSKIHTKPEQLMPIVFTEAVIVALNPLVSNFTRHL